LARRQISRERDGSYRLRLSGDERELLESLPAQLDELLDEPANPDLRRLFPAAYEDEQSQDEYSLLVGDELMDGRRRALATIASTAGGDRLTPEQADAWLTGLNALRLVLGTRIDVTEDEPPRIDPRDPQAHETAIYVYLSWLQEQLVEAMASSL
jgi:hypothetical protein